MTLSKAKNRLGIAVETCYELINDMVIFDARGKNVVHWP